MLKHDAALLNSVYWTTFTLGRLTTIPLAAVVPPERLLLPTIALEISVSLLILAYPASTTVLWAGTVGAGIGVCALYSNTVSLLAAYDLLTPRATGQLQFACSLGHLTIPKLVAVTMGHSSLGHDSLFVVLAVANSACLAIVLFVTTHLANNFTPAKGSLLEAAKQRKV